MTEEYVDQAPATDLARRTAWRALLDQAGRRKVDLVLVWRVDRAFRSVLDAANTLTLSSSANIDGSATLAWTTAMQSYRLVSDGVTWHIV